MASNDSRASVEPRPLDTSTFAAASYLNMLTEKNVNVLGGLVLQCDVNRRSVTRFVARFYIEFDIYFFGSRSQ